MKVRFQADADLDGGIVRGLRRAGSEIDIQAAVEAALFRLPDSEVLGIAADAGRVLVSQDRSTMPAHFHRFVENRDSPVLILLRAGTSISAAIETLVLIWAASEAEEWRNRIVWIPL